MTQTVHALGPSPGAGRSEVRLDVLTAAEFEVLWEQLALGPTPVVLRLDPPARSRAERRALAGSGWQAMRERGLAGPGGPDPELVRRMHLLARPDRQIELRGWWGRSVRAIAASRAGAGVLALRQDGTVTLATCSDLASELVGVLPRAGPAPGPAVTTSTDALTHALAAAEPLAALLAGGVEPAVARPLAAVLVHAERRGQLVALVTDRWGVPRRAGGVVAVLDSPDGRYLLSRSAADPACTTVTPVDGPGLTVRLDHLLRDARREVDG